MFTDVLRGKRVVVTGSSTGIGEQIAYHYARLGASVLVTARREAALKQVTQVIIGLTCQMVHTGSQVIKSVNHKGHRGHRGQLVIKVNRSSRSKCHQKECNTMEIPSCARDVGAELQ